jgi:hypothetical protein
MVLGDLERRTQCANIANSNFFCKSARLPRKWRASVGVFGGNAYFQKKSAGRAVCLSDIARFHQLTT